MRQGPGQQCGREMAWPGVAMTRVWRLVWLRFVAALYGQRSSTDDRSPGGAEVLGEGNEGGLE